MSKEEVRRRDRNKATTVELNDGSNQGKGPTSCVDMCCEP